MRNSLTIKKRQFTNSIHEFRWIPYFPGNSELFGGFPGDKVLTWVGGKKVLVEEGAKAKFRGPTCKPVGNSQLSPSNT